MTTLDITIAIADVDEFKTGFLKACPKPPHMAHMNDLQYLKQWLEDNLFNAYKTGKLLIAQETTPPTVIEDIVDVS